MGAAREIISCALDVRDQRTNETEKRYAAVINRYAADVLKATAELIDDE